MPRHVQDGRIAPSLEQPGEPGRTWLGDAPGFSAIGTADVHHEGRARHHLRIVPAAFARLNRETTDPSFGDVGWTTHWFAAWLVSPRASNGLPVLVLVSIRTREPSPW